jgi:predicted enzyme related to lactoylglutathione lyase
MIPGSGKPVVHLELHTPSEAGARDFYGALCGWRTERIAAAGCTYLRLDAGSMIGAGIVECATERPLWLPYVEVTRIAEATDRARLLGASVLLEPREGPAGFRSVIATPHGGEIAFWQPKR